MKFVRFNYALYSLLVTIIVAFSAQIAVSLADPEYQEVVNQLAPVFGVALGILLVGGYRYIPWIFLGALLPSLPYADNWMVALSVPIAVVVSASLGKVLVNVCRVPSDLATIRSSLILLLIGGLLTPLVGALMQTLLLFLGEFELVWGRFQNLLLSNWLAGGVGAMMCFPFILAWSNRETMTLGLRQMLEVLLWLTVLIVFGWITFENWAPTDVLLYPMELAIFPIMAWGGIRLGLRGATAGVLVLALVAAWELVPVLGADARYISQSPANVWIFVAIVSITSLCLASVMTELRAREAEIADNEGRLSAFTNALPDIAFVLSDRGRIEDAFASSPEIEANHRIVNADTVRGKRLDEVFDDVTARRFESVVRDVLNSRTLQTCEYSLESVDVGEHWFEARVSPMLSGSGVSNQVVWVAYNITRRKYYEQAIQQRDGILQATALANNALLTNRDFQGAVESAIREIGVALKAERINLFEVFDPSQDGSHQYRCRVEWRDDAGTPALIHEGEESVTGSMEGFLPGWYQLLVDQDVIKLDSDANLEPSDCQILEALESRSLLSIPLRVEARLHGFLLLSACTHERVWGEAEVNALRVLASSLAGLILIQENQEALQIARDRADAASVAKGEFLAMMSHEIRTPMNAIIGYTDLLRQTNLDELQAEQASIIKRSGKALLELINNILDYSKIESRTLELETSNVDVEQVVCEALEYILPQSKEKALKIDFEISETVNAAYWGDPHRLRQILMNFANNAVKFTDTGSIRIDVDLKHSESSPDTHALYFRVTDTGCGIPEDKFDRLFKPFSQVDSSTTRQFGGTGLGLVISKRLIERMDGRVWVSSQVGEGTTFHFVVNLSLHGPVRGSRPPFKEHAVTEEPIDAAFAEEYPLDILLCEDDEDNRWVIAELLQSLGYVIDVVVDAEEAMSRFGRVQYDVILLDVQLPEVSGIELTQLIRSGELGVELRSQYIVAVTAFAMREDQEECLAAGMNDYLRKPLEIARLKDALISAYKRLKS
ncbi:ATP-binding protein [Coraliomargarita akajimensis]|uniref:histidine kinase n=1 Tax=Coraliomargarita akajimensis (strain DSM 45221 / IAM 15411 / JCM 23193 / KCTC 12865 / 04OKA010-24) TaxID=583355 RepID=D5EHW5_CORAD|nr:ATP-binding protein [Coraliomargarita akajimensis]ADE54156.1 multi-sensor hybrid histidine kinase [Coraliomargarita akajimensis DSM 45221]